MMTPTIEELEEAYAKTRCQYALIDEIYYLKMDDGRFWCPSAQARGVKYKYEQPRFYDYKEIYNLGLKDYVAIDLETVLQEHSSYPCQIGIVSVCDGKIEDKINSLIKPPGNKFDKRTQEIHHITPEMTKNAPSFRAVWDDIKQYFENTVIVAHNAASADLCALYNAFKKYDIEEPEIAGFIDTYHLSGESLAKATARYGIELNNHHDALADAMACSDVYLALSNGVKPKTDEDVEVILKERGEEVVVKPSKPIQQDMFATDEIFTPSSSFATVSSDDLQIEDEILETYDFDGKVCVLSGDSEFRDKLTAELPEIGAKVTENISGKTNALIVSENVGPSKKEKAKVQKNNRPDSFHIFSQKAVAEKLGI